MIGDYVLQSDWMANEKTKQFLAAWIHASVYTLGFRIWFDPSVKAVLFIFLTHFAIDRWRLARHVVYAKNLLAPPSSWQPWSECSGTGYHKDRPAWMTVWLLIIADNTLHLLCNGFALTYL